MVEMLVVENRENVTESCRILSFVGNIKEKEKEWKGRKISATYQAVLTIYVFTPLKFHLQ